MSSDGLKAFVLGATGAVGSRLVELLAKSSAFEKVALFGRRRVEAEAAVDMEQKLVNFDNLEEHADDFKGYDVAFCALGTTRAKSGAQGFYKVDHDYVVNSARIAKENGVKQFILVSSGGANANSMFLYMKTKGETERDIAALNFDKFLILHPGVLEGPREEFRLAECAAKFFLAPIKLISNQVAISTADVGKAMIIGALATDIGPKEVWDNATLLKKASEYDKKFTTSASS